MKNTLGLILAEVKNYQKRFVFTGVLIMVLSSIVWVRPALIRHAVDVEIANGDYQGMVNVFSLIVLVLLFEALLKYRVTYLANWVAQSVSLDLRTKLFKHIMSFRLKFFDRTPVGKLVTRLISDIDGIANVFSNGLLNAIGDLLTLTVVLIAMFIINPSLTLIVILPIPVLLFATRIFQKHIKKSFADVRNQVSNMNEFVQEHVTGMHIVQAFSRESEEAERFEELNCLHRDANVSSIKAFSIFFPVVEMLSATSVALLLWLGVGGVVSGEITLGEVLQFVLYVFMLYRPIRQLADRFNVLQLGIINADRVFKLMNSDETLKDTGTREDVEFAGKIEFRDVWFAYNDENWVLKGLSFTVEPGSTVAFVGSTGAGKSTIINLLSRFYDFQKGSILIDGVDIRDIKLSYLRENVGVVQQEVFLMSDTLRANVTLHDDDVSDKMIWDAAERVGAADFIRKYDDGLDLNVRERGAMLSVGQRQLIAFMRAYVASPSILILDEATSSIDSESEQMIQKATASISEGRTALIVAHRFSTIRDADKIFVIDSGLVVEFGTHDELIALNGVYHSSFFL
ncbi:MAG TPA: ABC transporter ATP-binding protein [Flavobacteriales bacterium]|nr:ABC transporter ATP-binding protein [Flavobacteriales bacterium]HIB78587.1 ABC transporter ATP-binding protein [Flavobacteriales bacterium]HIN41983.1 ABC transporter ATP-binding protein [Flavobacteriales bacterium]HIO15867.1 ABC transporter ATP-binding protein [Flavobacteriales bacterium]